MHEEGEIQRVLYTSLSPSAKPNESLKLMLVGLQRMGKTTLLSRLREVNEAQVTASTFNERVKGEDKGKQSGFLKSRKRGGQGLSTHTRAHTRTHTHTHTHTHTAHLHVHVHTHTHTLAHSLTQLNSLCMIV